MTRKTLAAASLGVIVIMIVVGTAVASSLPVGMQLPTHWGIDGQPDRFSSKWSALLTPALLTAGLAALFYFIPALESRRTGIERSKGLYFATWAGLLLLGPVIQLAVISAAYGWPVESTTFILGGLGLLFAVIGSQLGKSRSMYLIGIRTPWTLASEDVWIKTHRLGGKLMFGAGVAILLGAFLPLKTTWLAVAMMVLIFAAVLIPVVYSYVLWRAELRGGQH